MVGGFLLQRIIDVHRSIFLVRYRIDADLLLVEITQLREFALGPDDIRTTELLSRQGSDLPANDILSGLVVPLDLDVLDRCLRTFHDPDLMVNGIVVNGSLDRIDLEEEITVVHVQGTDVSTFLRKLLAQFLVQGFDVVDLSLPDPEQHVQDGIGILGITLPGHVPEIIPATLVNLQCHIEIPLSVVVLGIRRDHGVTISNRVIIFQDFLLVFPILFIVELGGAEAETEPGFQELKGLCGDQELFLLEEILGHHAGDLPVRAPDAVRLKGEAHTLLGALHLLLQLGLFYGIVTKEMNLIDPNLLTLVDLEFQDHTSGGIRVRNFLDIGLSTLETLFRVIF